MIRKYYDMEKFRINTDRKDNFSSEGKVLGTTRNTMVINASRESLYHSFTDPEALEAWLAPGEMTGKIHNFDLRVGKGYTMSLFYPATEKKYRGKTSDKEDRFSARFIELSPPSKIVQAITFDTENQEFCGEMIMEVYFEIVNSGTKVIIVFKNIPSGIRPEDNETGTRLSLEKLARQFG